MFYTDLDDNGSSDDNGQNASVKLYEMEWTSLSNITDIDELRNSAINGELRTSRFRSICWRLLLNIIEPNSSQWLIDVEHHRTTYENIVLEHYYDPHVEDSGSDDPLSQNDYSTWKQYFKDIELKKIIQQDVVRTSPGVEFFRTEKIQKTMIDILFFYSREHSDLSYRQGMHEILAPLLFVLHCDHQALLHVQEQSSSDVSDVIMKILNPGYLEADAYSLFSTIMEIMKDYYNVNDYMMSTIVLDQTETVKVASSTPESAIVRKLSKIRDKLLKMHDLELFEHLINLDISFTTFGVRWLRLLFGGEFSLMDLLVLWDTIFAKSSEHFAIIDSIFVAMLILLRVQLLKSDNTNCLNYLMRYPNVDVMSVIKYALHLFDPETYALPSVINSLNYDKSDNQKSNVDNQRERPTKFAGNFPTRQTHNSSDDLLELCRIKLLQYHSILSPVVPNHNKEARQALSGILELCGMLNSSRPGIIEMGKDVIRSTTPLQTPITPESPGGPLLPPPASEITMKVFRKTESSVNSQIQGAPTKNPLKQIKRFQQDNDNTVGVPTVKIQEIQCNDVKTEVFNEDDYNIITIKPEDIGPWQNTTTTTNNNVNGLAEFFKFTDLCDCTTQPQKRYCKTIVPIKMNVVDSEHYINIAGQEKKVTFVRPKDMKRHLATVDRPAVGSKTSLLWDSSGTYKEDIDKYIVEEELDVDDNDTFNSLVEGGQVTVILENKASAGQYMQTNEGGGGPSWHNKAKKRSSSTNDVNRVKRPLNPFMMWATVERRRMNHQYPKMHNIEVSKVLGARWNQMTSAEQAPYIQESARLRDLYMKMHPDYKYKARRKTVAFNKKLP